MSDQPVLVPFRHDGGEAAIVFVHGFSGDAAKTWGDFPTYLETDARLAHWDIFGLGYATSLRLDVTGIWAADPDLTILGKSFRTALAVPPLKGYGAVALVAHSMGGLVVQFALLDPSLAQRATTVAFFGTPSGGLTKARFGWFLKQQARDMAKDSPFVTDLRGEWSRRFDPSPGFRLLVVAGERDQFVPPDSSLAPFPEGVQRVVPGNHLEIVKPRAADDRSVQLLIDALLSQAAAPNIVDSARVAVERGRFKEAVDALLPRADRLDGDALVQLALALDTLGRSQEALGVLEQRYKGGVSSTDAVGVLAGRLKRRWLVNREQSDWNRAHDLYAEGLRRSTPIGGSEPSNDQAMYHAINLAFLELMITPTGSPVPSAATRYAQDAHAFANAAAAARRAALPGAGEDHWQLASIGDALAIEGHLDDASAAYTQARKVTASPREIDSMYGQALLVAEHIYGQDGARAIEKAFAMNLIATS